MQVTGRLARPRGPFNGFDERTWLARRGIHVVLKSPDGSWLDAAAASGAARPGPHRGADGVRRRRPRRRGADARLDRARRRRRAVAQTRDAFRASGLAHLLAVSGGNVALLVAAVLVLVWVAGGTRVGGHVGALVAVVGYVGLVGPSPSVVRAGRGRRAGVGGVAAVAAVRSVAPVRGRVWPSSPCLNPYNLADPGFQLSFAAVAAIILVAPRLREALEGLPFVPGLRAATAISAACTLATAPIGWWHFGRLNLIAAVPANLLALPAVPALLWMGLAAGAVAPFAPSARRRNGRHGPAARETCCGRGKFGAASTPAPRPTRRRWPRRWAPCCVVIAARAGRSRGQ